jgi:hypothetical protein
MEVLPHLAVLMADPTPPSAGSTEPEARLTERVIARIRDAHRTIPRLSGPGLGKGRRGRAADPDMRALRRVFLDFGDSYRSYRQRTGEPVSTEVRDAALRFRRELNLVSLVSVAASLQRLDSELVG